jgi:HAE1 family hydrophobic/amphiphilic exporter-1/multidrug efflux pump
MYVKNSKGDLIQMDNIVVLKSKANPAIVSQQSIYGATVSAGLAQVKVSTELKQWKIKTKILDDTFTTDLEGNLEILLRVVLILHLHLDWLYYYILILAAQFESFIDPFIIITVPMAVAGALFSLWLFDQTWNIFSQIGTVMLIGLVTKTEF